MSYEFCGLFEKNGAVYRPVWSDPCGGANITSTMEKVDNKYRPVITDVGTCTPDDSYCKKVSNKYQPVLLFNDYDSAEELEAGCCGACPDLKFTNYQGIGSYTVTYYKCSDDSQVNDGRTDVSLALTGTDGDYCCYRYAYTSTGDYEYIAVYDKSIGKLVEVTVLQVADQLGAREIVFHWTGEATPSNENSIANDLVKGDCGNPLEVSRNVSGCDTDTFDIIGYGGMAFIDFDT